MDALDLVMQGKFEVESGMMIDVQLLRNGLGCLHQSLSLNDAVIKARVLHTIKIKLWVDGFLTAAFLLSEIAAFKSSHFLVYI